MPITPAPPLPPRFVGVIPDDDWARIADELDEVVLAPGADVVREGDDGQDLFVVLDGEGNVEKAGAQIGRVLPGDLVGELGLLLGRPRAATVRAGSRLRLGRLSRERFLALQLAAPMAGVRLAEAIARALGARLTEMTESVVSLLAERSTPRRSHLELSVDGQQRTVPMGTPAAALLPREVDGVPVVAALLDRKALPLNAPLSAGGTLEPLLASHWEGRRVIAESLALALLEAAHRLDPSLTVRVGPSLGHGRLLEVSAHADDLGALAARLDGALGALVAEDAPLRGEWWTAEEAVAHFAERGAHDAAARLALWRHATVELVTYGHVYAPRQGALLASTRALQGSRVEREGSDLILVVPGEGPAVAPVQEARAAARDVRRMLRAEDRFLDALGITSVGAFNRASISGDVPRLVRVIEGFHEKRIAQIADTIARREHAVRVVCIAGPSSSGKTTFIKRLTVQLQVNGLRPHNLSLDDYYVDRDKTPRDARGELDFEALEALDVPGLQRDLARLFRGDEVRTPRFDFQRGLSVAEGGPRLTLGEGEVLLLEGIHGLNPRLVGELSAGSVFRVFVCPLRTLPFDAASRIHASDLRLLRRIVRDRHGRSTTAADNILRWPSVRHGERVHIFPHQHHADAVFDTSLVYELSVLKVYAERYLLEVPRGHAAYTTAHRLLALLDGLVSIYPDHVPPTSILREFIGGSGFEY